MNQKCDYCGHNYDPSDSVETRDGTFCCQECATNTREDIEHREIESHYSRRI
jgi:hypothetical protein